MGNKLTTAQADRIKAFILSVWAVISLLRLQFFEKLRNGFIEHWMAIVRCQLSQWNQYKIPVFHIDMRNMKHRCINDHLVV